MGLPGNGGADDAPLDRFVGTCVRNAVEAACSAAGGVQHHVRLSSDTGPLFVDMLRAAKASGLAYLDPTLHLCVHPLHGPWIALRAVVVLDADGATGRCAEAAGCAPLANPFPSLEPQLRAQHDSLVACGGYSKWQVRMHATCLVHAMWVGPKGGLTDTDSWRQQLACGTLQVLLALPPGLNSNGTQANDVRC